MVVDYRQLPIFKTLDPEERKGLALLGHPHCKRSFAHVAWMVRWWPLLTCVSMSQLDEDSLCGVHGGWNEQIPTPKNQPALIFAHMPFLNKQAVGQILHQPTVKAYMHWYCLQNMFWFGRMSHMSHMSLGGEVHETSVLCSVRKLFGTTDPGLDTDQRFIGASTWWGDELTSWRVVSVVSVVFVFFWVWTVWKASHGYHWTKCNQPFFVETCWDIQWECLMDESKVCERKHCVRELAMWSKMGELHGHLRLCFRPAANGCNTGSRRLLKTAPGREFKGNQGLVIWKLRLNSERHGIRQSSQVRELFVTVLILLAISQQKWFCLYKHLESLESQVPNNLPSSPCFTQA